MVLEEVSLGSVPTWYPWSLQGLATDTGNTQPRVEDVGIVQHAELAQGLHHCGNQVVHCQQRAPAIAKELVDFLALLRGDGRCNG